MTILQKKTIFLRLFFAFVFCIADDATQAGWVAAACQNILMKAGSSVECAVAHTQDYSADQEYYQYLGWSSDALEWARPFPVLYNLMICKNVNQSTINLAIAKWQNEFALPLNFDALTEMDPLTPQPYNWS